MGPWPGFRLANPAPVCYDGVIKTEKVEQMKNRTPGYASIQIFFWICYASTMGFASMYLLQAGFDNSQIGVLIAAAGLLSALLQPVAASYADRPGSLDLGKLVALSGGMSCVCAVGLVLSQGSRVLTGLLYGGCMVLLQLTTPMLNALGIATVNSGEKMNFGAARGFGSLGYAVAAYVMGLLAQRFGAVIVPVSMSIGFGLMLLFAMSYGPVAKEMGEKRDAAQDAFFRRYPRYAGVMVGLVLIFISHVVLNNFTFQIVEAKGGTSKELGVVLSFAAVLELPVMFLFGWMLKKVKSHVWFRISGVFFFLKSLGTLLCGSIPGFYAVQLFQMFGWALMTVSGVFYINAIMAPEDAVKGQSCYTVCLTLGNVIGAIAAGGILDSLGVQAMLLFGTVSALAGAVIILVFTQRTKA